MNKNMKMRSGFAITAFVSMIMALVVLPAATAPPPTVEFLGRHSGLHNLTRASKGASLFYFFFPSIAGKENAPLVIWLQGGPGSSDEFGLFRLNGPVHMSDHDGSLIWNEFSWNREANVLYVDQPVGTGFSDVVEKKDMCRDQNCASSDLYDFLQAFLRKNPGLAKNDFYITGESFAGHYIPAFASRIQRGNEAKEGIHVNMKGLAIGNGCTNPEIQRPSFNDYALQMGLINQTIYEDIAKHYIPPCLDNLRECNSGKEENCKAAYEICNNISSHIEDISHVDRFDVRNKCYGNCSVEDPILDNFLNQEEVKHSLRVEKRNFSTINRTVNEAMKLDGMINHGVHIPPLLEEDIQVLIYAGEFDLACNWIGNLRWIEDLTWWGKEGFSKAPDVSFVVDGARAGELRSYGPLNFLKVLNASHMVPKDEPKVALEMIQRWISNKLN